MITGAGYLKEQTEDDVKLAQRFKKEARILELKTLLKDTDYKALKYAEGVISAIDYLPIQRERQSWRYEINDLENLTK